MPNGGSNTSRVVIFTAIPVEYRAVRAHLSNLRRERHSKGTRYQGGTFEAGKRSWDIVLVETGMGNILAAVEAERAINHFNPILVLFVGVAGGLKDVALGDVVVAAKVYGYESGKAGETFQTRPVVGTPTYPLEQLARAEAREEDWLQRLKEPMPNPPPRVFVGPIAAGESVISSTHSTVWKLLKASYDDALAVEMESYGFLQAVHANPGLDALIIRGISDLVEGKSEADASNFKEIASRHASAFAFEIIAKLETDQLQWNGQKIKASTTLERRQSDHGIEEQQAFQTTVPDLVTNISLQEFCKVTSTYIMEIEVVRDHFGSGQDIYPDQCSSAIEALASLDEYIQKLNKDATTLDLIARLALVNMRDLIKELKLELQKFRFYRPLRTRMQRRQHENDYKKVHADFDSLLKS